MHDVSEALYGQDDWQNFIKPEIPEPTPGSETQLSKNPALRCLARERLCDTTVKVELIDAILSRVRATPVCPANSLEQTQQTAAERHKETTFLSEAETKSIS